MGSKSGLGLKFLQWFIRGIQFACAAIVLALSSYFLATLSGHRLDIPVWLRAVEGIAGVATLYTALGLLLLCCLAGHPFTSFIAIVLDVAFVGAFIYVATAYRNGSRSCSGTVDSVYGTGDADAKPRSNTDSSSTLPTFRNACHMEKANLAVAIVAIFFFILSAFVEVILVRHRRKEQRFGPSPANNYTSGSARGGKFMGMFKRRGTTATSGDPNALPHHTSPEQVRPSYTTDTTAVGQDNCPYNNKYGESGYGHDGTVARPETGVSTTHPSVGLRGHDGTTTHPQTGVATSHPSAGYRYNDGTYNA